MIIHRTIAYIAYINQVEITEQRGKSVKASRVSFIVYDLTSFNSCVTFYCDIDANVV